MEELEQREKELNDRQLLNQIESDLKENNLPTSFSETLLSLQDNEKIKGKIVEIKEEFDAAVNEQVKEAHRQDTPGQSTTEKEVDPFRSEEHTSELQSRGHLVCRLLIAKNKHR